MVKVIGRASTGTLAQIIMGLAFLPHLVFLSALYVLLSVFLQTPVDSSYDERRKIHRTDIWGTRRRIRYADGTGNKDMDSLD